MVVESIAARAPLREVEVAVVGAGPVGLIVANLLGIAGVQVAVLEANEGLLGLPRAIAYDAETLRLFSQIGLLNDIKPGLIQNPHVRHLNARGRVLMQATPPACGPYGHSSLGTFYQPEFERVLLRGLARFDNVRVLFGHTVTNLVQSRDEAALSIATRQGASTLRAKFVIGCDGGTSRVRDLLGARLIGSTYTQRWLATPSAGWWSTPSSRVTTSSRSASTATRAARASNCRRWATACVGNSCSFRARPRSS